MLLQKLVVTAVSLAIARDGASGGVVRTVTVSYFLLYYSFTCPLYDLGKVFLLD